ncbi:MAG: anti-sigma factor RsbA family regulatory protein [Solirubrobacteraceae bacterium]
MLAHQALLYHDRHEYVDGVLRFLEPALQGGEPIAIAVPASGQRLLRERLNGAGERARFLDMEALGRNPAQIIPAVRVIVSEHVRRRVHYVGEPIWAGRTNEEIAEATIHEELINLAFPDAPIRILCPYDTTLLDPDVIVAAHRTHPHLAGAEGPRASPGYADPGPPRDWLEPLAPAPANAASLCFTLADLGRLRARVARHASAAGLGRDGRDGLVIAVNELATNSIKYGGGSGVLRIWTAEDRRLICEVRDAGEITDPLAGRIQPAPDASGGRGLWLVNQLSELVQMRTGPAGTAVRIRTSPD